MLDTTPRLIPGNFNKRLRCDACGRMVPLYVDRGDGSPLRRRPWSLEDHRCEPDATLDTGSCLFASDVLDACPFCGHANSVSGIPWGRPSDIRGTWSPSACDTSCQEATGTDCKCSCRGFGHGTL